MIVKNEAHVITRAFDSVKNIITHIYICDTGSTDGTQEVIRKYIKDNKLKGKVVNKPWVDFAYNRNESFELGFGKADYIMTMDADEVFCKFYDDEAHPDEFITELPYTLEAEMYDIRSCYGTTRFWRPQLLKGDVKWEWVKPIHEYVKKKDEHIHGPCDRKTLVEICNYPRNEGGRALTNRKEFHDALVLEKYLAANPEDWRCWWYLGQCYMDDGSRSYRRSIEAHEVALPHMMWVEEKYIAYLRIGRMYKHFKEEDKMFENFHKAHEILPYRPEALYELMAAYRRKNMNSTAVLYGQRALEVIPMKKNYSLFLEDHIYKWSCHDELSLSYFYAGRYKDCLELCVELEKIVPEAQKERFLKNLNGFRKLAPVS